MTAPRTARQVFDQNFLEMRCKLIELAAALDRIDRADSNEALDDDPRLRGIDEALAVLASHEPNRAERIQLLFSDPYVAGWNR